MLNVFLSFLVFSLKTQGGSSSTEQLENKNVSIEKLSSLQKKTFSIVNVLNKSLQDLVKRGD